MSTKQPQLLIHGYRLDLTCLACPEQYDVYDNQNVQVAYFRLRHGKFTAVSPDVGGILVYSSNTTGDGTFHAKERIHQLTSAIVAVQNHIANTNLDLREYY